MFDFDRYFLKECQIYLSHLEYDVLSLGNGDAKLTIRDSVAAYPKDDGHVKMEIVRSLDFGAGKLFSLTAIFGVLLTKNPLSVNEIDWSQVDIAAEFKKSKTPLINNIASRISLLIGQVTSSFGQNPVITPPQLLK